MSESVSGSSNRQRLYDARGLMYGASAQTLGSSLTIQLLVLVSGVVAARALGAEDRGHLAIFWLIPVTLSLIGGIGMPQATTYFVAQNPGNVRPVVRNAVRISTALSLLLVLVYGVGMSLLYVPDDPDLGLTGLISVALIPALIAQAVALAVLQGQQRFLSFNLVRMIAPATYVLALIALLGFHEVSLDSAMMALVGSWSLGAFLTWILVIRELPDTGKPANAGPKEMMSFGVRGVLGSVSPIDDLRIDQIIVGIAVDPRALGLYVAAIAFCNLPRFIAQSIGLVSYPRVASSATSHDAWTIVFRAIKIGFALIALTVIVLILAVPLALPFFFGDDFKDAVGLAQILLGAALFLSIRRLLTELCRGLGHPGYGSIGEIVSTVLLIAGAVLVVPIAQETGVAWTVMGVSAISAAILGFLLASLYRKRRRDEAPF